MTDERNETTLAATLAAIAQGAAPSAGLRVVLGHLDGVDAEGRILFRPEGDETSRPVVIGLDVSDGALVKAARLGKRAFVLAPEGTATPILAGLLRERVANVARDAEPGKLEVRMEGDTLRLSAEREIELRCGRSRIVLHRDGRVTVSGSHLLQSATGPIRVKGATIALN